MQMREEAMADDEELVRLAALVQVNGLKHLAFRSTARSQHEMALLTSTVLVQEAKRQALAAAVRPSHPLAAVPLASSCRCCSPPPPPLRSLRQCAASSVQVEAHAALKSQGAEQEPRPPPTTSAVFTDADAAAVAAVRPPSLIPPHNSSVQTLLACPRVPRACMRLSAQATSRAANRRQCVPRLDVGAGGRGPVRHAASTGGPQLKTAPLPSNGGERQCRNSEIGRWWMAVEDSGRPKERQWRVEERQW